MSLLVFAFLEDPFGSTSFFVRGEFGRNHYELL